MSGVPSILRPPAAGSSALPLGSFLRSLAVLVKLPIALATAATALVGAWIAPLRGLPLLWVGVGTLLLAMGAGSLNQIQECRLDARMLRTCGRPLPGGRLGLGAAWGVVLLGVAGGTGLLAGLGLGPVLIGLATLVWYNAVYTPLKRVSALAVLPGALVGALPPFIGWTAAGRQALEEPILVLGFLLLVWQIPHFWLLVLRHGEDYRRAGFPTLQERLSPWGLERLTTLWIGLLACSTPLLPGVGLVRQPLLRGVVIAVSLALLGMALGLLRGWARPRAFLGVNLFGLLMGVVIVLDPLLR
nr:UbiA family prenyltransferase [uncultured Holophaga sp.]